MSYAKVMNSDAMSYEFCRVLCSDAMNAACEFVLGSLELADLGLSSLS